MTGSLYGLDHAECARRAGALFDLLELSAAERGRMIIDFSMGMKKKVALACALLHGPRLLFLDEPFNGIDAVTTRAIKDALVEATGRGVTVFFSSHILEQVERLCTRIGIIQAGRLRALGTLAEIRESLGALPDATLEDVFVQIVGGDRVARGRLEFLG
jgi:ABC-2 type transport system ATP-binding protein